MVEAILLAAVGIGAAMVVASTKRRWTSDTHRKIRLATLSVVAACVASAALRTPGQSAWWMIALAVPALVGTIATRRPAAGLIACELALLAWLPLGVRGDVSCDDCVDGAGDWRGIPVVLAVPQVGLAGASVIWSIRDRRSATHGPR